MRYLCLLAIIAQTGCSIHIKAGPITTPYGTIRQAEIKYTTTNITLVSHTEDDEP